MLKLFFNIFFINYITSQDTEHILRVFEEYFEMNNLSKLDLQEAIEVFARVYSGSDPRFMI